MRKFLILFVIAATAFTGSVALNAQTPAKAKAKTVPGRQALYSYVNAIQDVMESIVAPSADVLFDAVATDITAEGVNEKRPQTDDDWEKVEHNAVALVEAMNMVKMPGRIVARPGEKTKSEGPDAPELTAEEIKAKIDKDRGKFIAHANDLQKQAIKALDIARRHDAQGLFDIGEDIDNACESCHLEYWYPNDKAAKAAYEADQKLKAAEDKKKAQEKAQQKKK